MTISPLKAGNLSALEGVDHAFFTREGGVSGGIYASLNSRLGSDDARENVLENRARMLKCLNGEVLCTPYQTHSDICAIADDPWPVEKPPKADAVATSRPGIAIGVSTADCTPVLFADAKARVIAAAHAGWKGALGGVLEAALKAMEDLGARRENIACAIGPVISRDNYEVGPEFFARFAEENPAYARFFAPSIKAGHFMFDLPGFVRARLEEAGIRQVEDIRRCTYGNEALFFSYRRNTHRGESRYGCQLSAIMLTPSS